MRREDVVSAVKKTLRELGIAEHISNVRAVPSSVELEVIMGASRKVVRLRSGITSGELTEKMRELEQEWRLWRPDGPERQVDLEEAIAAASAT